MGIVKDSKVMFMLRSGKVPLRSKDGGSSWQELTSSAPLFKYGATMDGSLSWSGNTLVLHGVDLTAIGRGEYATSVWKSCDDGDTWKDQTGDLVTISLGLEFGTRTTSTLSPVVKVSPSREISNVVLVV